LPPTPSARAPLLSRSAAAAQQRRRHSAAQAGFTQARRRTAACAGAVDASDSKQAAAVDSDDDDAESCGGWSVYIAKTPLVGLEALGALLGARARRLRYAPVAHLRCVFLFWGACRSQLEC
jgi:hypothetical protein